MEENKYRYDAFISYRHGELDDFVAARLHKKLETYSLPRHIAKQMGRRKLSRVFRDREELMSSASLGQELEEALRDSNYLILICSSRTIHSPWVMKEITTFKTLHGVEHILLLIIEGTIETAIPDVLRVGTRTYEQDGQLVSVEEKIEPLATDIRGESKKEVGRKLDEEILRLIAPIAGCRYDDLKQRHKERRRKKLVGLALGCGLLLSSFGAFNAWRVWQIQEQMQQKLATQSRALADQSLRLLDEGDRMKAILVGKEALPKNLKSPEKPIMEEAIYALSEALYVYKYDFKLVPEKTLDYSRVLHFLKISPKGKWAATLSEEGYIEIWNLDTGEMHSIIKNENSFIKMDCFEFMNEDSYIVTTEKGLEVVQIATNEVSWKIGNEAYSEFYLSPNKGQLVVIGEQIKLYDVAKKQEIAELVGEEVNTYYATQVAWNEAMSLLAIGQNGKVFVWDLTNKDWLTSYETKYAVLSGIVFTNQNELAIATNDEYKDDLEYLYGNGRGNLSYIRLDGNKVEELWQLDSDESMIDKLKINPDDSQQLVMTKGNTLETVDASVGKVQYSLPQSTTIMNYCLLGNSLALCGMKDGSVRTLMLDVGGVYESASFKHSGELTDISYAGGRVLVTTGEDKKAYIYKDMTGSPRATFEGFEGSMAQGGYSQDGKWAYTLSDQEDKVLVWDMTKHLLAANIEVSDYVAKAGFIRDNQSIYTFSKERGISIWQLNGTLKQTFEDETSSEIYYAAPYFYLVDDTKVQVLKESNLELYKTIPITHVTRLIIVDEGQFLALDNLGKLSLINMQAVEETKGKDRDETIEGQVLKEVLVAQGVLNCIANEETAAIYLEDKIIEIMDLKTRQVIDTIANDGLALNCFVLNEANKQLWLGYEDTTVWCYSLETKERVQLRENLPSPMTDIYFYQSENRIAITTEQKELLIYNLENQKQLAYLKEIVAINGQCDEFIRRDYETLYVIPLYTVEMLVEEAEKQLVGKQLTKQEKEKYFIEE